jgi:UDP-N-acetylglucosamine acyltransferase
MVTRVGSDCLIMAYVHIAHDVQVGDHVILANACNVAGHVVIEDHVIIEGMVGIQQFVRVGKHAFIAGGSLVRKNVPPYIKAAREPLSYIGINGIGLRRRGFDIDRIQSIEDIYRTLYVLNNNMTQAVKAAELELPTSDDKDTVLSFIRQSDKGIIRGPF